MEYAGDPEYIDKPFKPHKEWLKQHFKGVTFDELIKFGLKKKKYIQDIKKYITKKIYLDKSKHLPAPLSKPETILV